MSYIPKKLGEILRESGVVTELQLNHALSISKVKKKRLGEILVELGFVTENNIADALSKKLKIPVIDCTEVVTSPELKDIIPEHFAEERLVFPIEKKDTTLILAMSDPLDIKTIDEISFKNNLRVSPVISPRSSILKAIQKHYSGINVPVDAQFLGYKEIEREEEVKVSAAALYARGKLPKVVRLVSTIIAEAIRTNASDIHIEPEEKNTQVRFRVHGELRNTLQFDRNLHESVVSRIKILSNLDITNRRLPQDGGIRASFQEQEIDLRVSTLPSLYGEKIVIRLLNADGGLMALQDLEMPNNIRNSLFELLKRPQGMLIVTGPTGSGKTTTLYACLNHLRSETRNIVTIEDPVEYKLKGINQVSVNENVGRTFASVLRSVLRQDPDIILIGEIRDIETAEIAMKASLTGHFVLTTLHTNNTVATITRLTDIGVPPYLLDSAISGILAQRLVRKICNNCKVKLELPEKLYSISGFPELTKCYYGTGCPKCSNTGYSGRTAVYEYLVITPSLRKLISKNAGEEELLQAAKNEGVTSLFEDAWNKIKTGTTTVEEVIAKVPLDYRPKS